MTTVAASTLSHLQAIFGTILVGIVGLVFEHNLRTVFAKPTAAASSSPSTA